MKIITTLLFALIILVSAYFIIGFGTIIKNGTSVTNKPGTMARLKLFFSTNTAETQNASTFPELQPRQYSIPASDSHTVSEKIISVAESLGYEYIESKSTNNALHFTITTSLFKFVDDLILRITINKSDTDTAEVTINAISQSRTGRADFGANVANIVKFFTLLDNRLT